MNPDADTRKPGRPAKPSTLKAAEAADALLDTINTFDDRAMFEIGRALNMRHDMLMSDFTRSLKAFAALCRGSN